MHGWRSVGAAAALLAVGCAHAPAEPAPAKVVSRCTAKVSPTSEGEHGVTGALAQLNAELRAAHQAARVDACETLGEQRLVIRWAFGKLEARWRGRLLTPEGLDVIPASYHPLKDVAHAVLLASLLFELPPGRARDEKVAAAIRAIDGVLGELDGAGPASKLIPPEQLPRQGRMLERTRAALEKFAAGRLSEAEQRQYFAQLRPDVAENLRVVAEELLRNLDREVKEVRRKVEAEDPKGWDSVLVLAASVHQARARELGVQYFERLLAEPVGEGARNERRLVVSESVFAEADQYGLLALHLVDQAAAAEVFGDPLRLQWDALGDPGGALDAVLPPR